MEPVTLVVTGRSLHQSALLFRSKGRLRNGRWRPIPKSAPPQLSRRRPTLNPSRATSGRSMRVGSAHGARPSPEQPPPLSVQDVYQMAERTRVRMSTESRRSMLVNTQKMVRNDSGMSRPMTGLSSRGYSQGAWYETNSAGHGVRRRKRVDVEGGGESGEDSPGFVSNVRISRKPRSAPASSHHHCDDGASSTVSDHHDKRLNSALTVASSYRGSEFSCVSPRPAEPEARKMSVSRQCCEVMGPGVCRDCQKLRVRMMDRERMEADFPRLRVSEKNVTTSAVVMRVLPDMTQAEIQDKIARGEIDRGGLLFPPRRAYNSDDSDDDDDNRLRLNGLHAHFEQKDTDSLDSDGSSRRDSTRRPNSKDGVRSKSRGADSLSKLSGKSANTMVLLTKLKVKLGGEASTPLFFMDLKHMNSKIFHGKVGKNLKPPRQEERANNLSLTVAEPNCPTFVSPRKSKMIEEPAYKVYFDPPLLAKHRQGSNPSFFAGSDNPYCLPERLPEVLEFADGKMSITDPNAIRPESSMSFVSAISEEAPELSQRSDMYKNSKAPSQETVQE